MSLTSEWPGIAPAPRTPQSQPLPGREAEMQQNPAGGFGFIQSPLGVLERFLILGTTGGTFYVTQRKLTEAIAPAVEQALTETPAESLALIVSVLHHNRAVRPDSALFALALWFARVPTAERDAVLHGRFGDGTSTLWREVILAIKTGAQLMQFVAYWCDMRGTGRILRTLLRDWYTHKPFGGAAHVARFEDIEYQMLKYRNRHGFTHRDLLRLGHIKPPSDNYRDLFKLVCARDAGKPRPEGVATARWQAVDVFDLITSDTTVTSSASLIAQHRLTHDMLPTAALEHDFVWRALAPHMPSHALLRNLATLTRRGVFGPDVASTDALRELLLRLEIMIVHPLHLLRAQRMYMNGGVGGKSQAKPFDPDNRVVAALSEAITMNFERVAPLNARLLVAVDVSGSMNSPSSVENLFSCRELAIGTACWLVRATHAAGQAARVIGFDTSVHSMNWVHPKADPITAMREPVSGGGTDAGQPIVHAIVEHIVLDAIILLTDNDSWRGLAHTSELMKRYRQEVNPNAKLIIFSMVTGETVVGDPRSPLDFFLVGWDGSAVDTLAAILNTPVVG